jgi:hypothetical protein
MQVPWRGRSLKQEAILGRSCPSTDGRSRRCSGNSRLWRRSWLQHGHVAATIEELAVLTGPEQDQLGQLCKRVGMRGGLRAEAG